MNPKIPWRAPGGSITPTSEERLVEAISTHWIKFIVPFTLYFLLGGAGLTILTTSGIAGGRNAFAIGLFLVALTVCSIIHHWFFNRILSEGMVDLIITNKRIIYLEEHLWFHDEMHEIALGQLMGVQAHKHNLLQNILRYGDLWFDTGGSELSEKRTLHRMPHPHRIARTIMQLLEMK